SLGLEVLLEVHNLEELEIARQFYNNLGIDYFQPRYAYSQSAVNNFIAQKSEDNNLLIQNSKMPKKYKNFCFWLWFILIIKANKTILPCCYEFFKIPILGDYNNEKNIADIWNSEKYRNFRESVLKYRQIMNCCKNCDSSFGFQDNVLLKK
ncbi:MAG TPA: SPASM domain-containing protein, partial [bacterium]|nr:SPASM domain-containing protein [bacterium]